MSIDGSDRICQVSIYLKGDSLNPSELTRQLGVEPTRSHRKGHRWVTSSGKEVVERTGLWVLSIKHQTDISAAFADAASKLPLGKFNLCQCDNVEDAFVDVFMTASADEDGGGTIEFFLDIDCITAISKIGLPVQFTTAIVRK